MRSKGGRWLWQCRLREVRQRLFVVYGLALCSALCSVGLAEDAVAPEKLLSYCIISHSFCHGLSRVVVRDRLRGYLPPPCRKCDVTSTGAALSFPQNWALREVPSASSIDGGLLVLQS